MGKKVTRGQSTKSDTFEKKTIVKLFLLVMIYPMIIQKLWLLYLRPTIMELNGIPDDSSQTKGTRLINVRPITNQQLDIFGTAFLLLKY